MKKELFDLNEKYHQAEVAKGTLERTNAELSATCSNLRSELSRLGGIQISIP